MITTAVLLAGGKSSRLEPLDMHQNKGLLVLGGISLAERTIRMLTLQGITRIVCITSPRDRDSWQGIASKVKLDSQVILEIIEQPAPTGMANALLQAKDLLNEDFLVVFPYHYERGDTITQLANLEHDAVVVTKTDTPHLYGIVTFDPDAKKMISLVEKPQTRGDTESYKLVGLYRLSPAFITELELHQGEYAFEEALDAYAEKQDVFCVITEEPTLSLKYAWHLLDHLSVILSQLRSHSIQLGPTVVIDESQGPVVIEENCHIGHFTILKGPIYMGKNVFIGDHCLIRESSIEANSVIGAYTEVARSVLMEKVKVHYSYIADSLIGPSSNIGAGLLTTNKRLDRRTIRVTVRGNLVDSNRTRLGALIGPSTVFGSRVTTMPGTVIEENTVVLPNMVLPDKMTAKLERPQ